MNEMKWDVGKFKLNKNIISLNYHKKFSRNLEYDDCMTDPDEIIPKADCVDSRGHIAYMLDTYSLNQIGLI